VSAAVLTGIHHGYELSNGVGLVLQPELGLVGSSILWGTQLPTWSALAVRGGGRWDRLLAVWSGAALAGVLVHFRMWPLRRSRWGLPVLAEAEGLEGARLTAYNVILYVWGVTSTLAIVRDLPRGRRRWALVGLATLPLQSASAAHHFAWLGRQASVRPAWWNRATAAT
jgi:hypothetical protein